MSDKHNVDANLQAAIHGCEGIFRALSWIDDGYLEGANSPGRIEETRALLIAAGEALCKMASDRF